MFFPNPILDLLTRGFVLTAIGMGWLVLLVRVNGLRSFSKMTSFDFVMTIATGSLLAAGSQTVQWTEFAQVVVAMASLFVVQFCVAFVRKRSPWVESMVQNEPIILMRDGLILDRALQKTRVTQSDLIAKLREANVLHFSQVRAVILETTGDLSVLHGESCSDRLLEGTREL